jgi:hypothetical protein
MLPPVPCFDCGAMLPDALQLGRHRTMTHFGQVSHSPSTLGEATLGGYR